MKKTIEKMALCIMIILFVWVGLSYLEIIFKNLENADYSNLNLIVKYMKLFE